ncbi:MAG: TraR/DksA C4-type zinc finger protein [bacterium]|nr:TraR/DksA C4-type zinc finger protein [bacterium]
MNEKQLEKYREILIKERNALQEEIKDLTESEIQSSLLDSSGGLSGYPDDPGDVASDNFEKGKDLEILDMLTSKLEEVQTALEKIDTGTYGVCELCSKTIPQSRLNVKPWAKLCMKCRKDSE